MAKRNYNLFSLIEWMAAIAFLCALLAGSGGQVSRSAEFDTLPPDDSTLLNWLEDQQRHDVAVTRDNNAVTLKVDTGLWQGMTFQFDIAPDPPWQELGYPAVKGASYGTQWQLFSGSPYLWLVGFGLLIALGFVGRRISQTASIRNQTPLPNA